MLLRRLQLDQLPHGPKLVVYSPDAVQMLENEQVGTAAQRHPGGDRGRLRVWYAVAGPVSLCGAGPGPRRHVSGHPEASQWQLFSRRVLMALSTKVFAGAGDYGRVVGVVA